MWGYDNIVVADASLFPMASGVNPMLTIMAMSARVAELNGGSLVRTEPAASEAATEAAV